MSAYLELFFLFLIALLGGAVNVAIGGGWFVIFPGLIFRGIQPVTGTATTTIILLSGFLASSKPIKKTGEISKRHFNCMVLVCTTGGVTGAFLLVMFSHKVFESIAPFLLLGSWILFTFYNEIQNYFNNRFAARKEFRYSHKKLIPIFLLGVYGGYFGAGMGMIIFILYSFYGIKNNDTLERLALFLVGANNGIAVLIFTCSGLIFWPFALVMITGSVLGGFLGNAFKEKINIARVKKNAIVIAATVTLYFLL